LATAVAPAPLKFRYVSEKLQGLLDAFVCTTSTGADLSRFLRERAIKEQEENISTTFVFLPPDESRVDAFVTLSATGVKTPPKYRERFPDRIVLPAVMIDYLAVSDAKRVEGGLGLRIFQWVESRVYPLNASVGVRFVALDVYASDWGAYRRYASADWGFHALPLRPDHSRREDSQDAPSADDPPPTWLRPDRLIPMVYDLVEHNGPFELPPPVASAST